MYYNIYFSPTGGTKKVADILISHLSKEYQTIDLCRENEVISLSSDDICLISVPSYGGRIPTTAAERLQKICANGARAILVCVYGNRAYEDTLSELQDVLLSRGFSCSAAVAAIAEHSIIREFAAGRPDESDHAELIGFAEKILDRLENSRKTTLIVPGGHGTYKPYKNTPFLPIETDACTNCGICRQSCPTNAIGNTPYDIDTERCIKCMRCASVCPNGARNLDEEIFQTLRERLAAVCSTRKANELFL